MILHVDGTCWFSGIDWSTIKRRSPSCSWLWDGSSFAVGDLDEPTVFGGDGSTTGVAGTEILSGVGSTTGIARIEILSRVGSTTGVAGPDLDFALELNDNFLLRVDITDILKQYRKAYIE